MTGSPSTSYRLAFLVRRFSGTTVIILLLSFTIRGQQQAPRHLTVTYTCYVSAVPETAREIDWWVPVPSSDERQKVEMIQADLSAGRMTNDKLYGNRMYYRHISLDGTNSKDTFTITLSYKVGVDEKSVPEASQLAPLPKAKTGAALQIYLKSNRLIPLEGPIEALKQQLQLPETPIPAARQIYDYLINTMVYNYQAPGAGRGDVLWACNSRTGDCSDFHSIFIGICRSSGIPADHVFGLPLKTKQGYGEARDWHCWARFWTRGPGWITIDASEASKHPKLRNYNFGSLSTNYLTLSHGRDVILQPAQKGEPLNIFADPYVEVDGRHFEQVKWVASFREEN